jgi:hypothetical protein
MIAITKFTHSLRRSENHKAMQGKEGKLTEAWNQCNDSIAVLVRFKRSEDGGFAEDGMTCSIP